MSRLHRICDHGPVVHTADTGLADARLVMRAPPRAGIELDDVGLTLERQGLASVEAPVNHVLSALEANTHVHSAR